MDTARHPNWLADPHFPRLSSRLGALLTLLPPPSTATAPTIAGSSWARLCRPTRRATSTTLFARDPLLTSAGAPNSSSAIAWSASLSLVLSLPPSLSVLRLQLLDCTLHSAHSIYAAEPRLPLPFPSASSPPSQKAAEEDKVAARLGISGKRKTRGPESDGAGEDDGDQGSLPVSAAAAAATGKAAGRGTGKAATGKAASGKAGAARSSPASKAAAGPGKRRPPSTGAASAGSDSGIAAASGRGRGQQRLVAVTASTSSSAPT